jgi:hypothetical protein
MIPRGANITHDGECFTLALVRTPPQKFGGMEQAFRPPPPGDFP